MSILVVSCENKSAGRAEFCAQLNVHLKQCDCGTIVGGGVWLDSHAFDVEIMTLDFDAAAACVLRTAKEIPGLTIIEIIRS